MSTRKVSSRPPPEPPPFCYAERVAAFLGAFDERDAIVAKTFWGMLCLSLPLLILSFWMWPSNVPALFMGGCLTVYAVTQVPRTIGDLFLRQRLSEVNRKYPLSEYDTYFFSD